MCFGKHGYSSGKKYIYINIMSFLLSFLKKCIHMFLNIHFNISKCEYYLQSIIDHHSMWGLNDVNICNIINSVLDLIKPGI